MLQNITNTHKITNKAQYISNPSELSDVIENYLFNIFEKELNTPNSVLLSYKPIAIKKISAYISGKISRTKFVEINKQNKAYYNELLEFLS